MEYVIEIVWILVSALALIMNEVDWKVAAQSAVMNLSDAEMGVTHMIEFLHIGQTDNGYIVATVASDTIHGDTLWLSGQYGLQNGAKSLMYNAKKNKEGEPIIEGGTFTFSRVESDKSPTGYAYHWE